MVLPLRYRGPEKIMANYDFYDIAAGTGIIKFYAGKTVDLNLLSNITFYSNTVCTETATGNPVPFTKIHEIDFSVTMNKPIVIGGKVVVNVPMKVYYAGGAGGPVSYHVVNILKNASLLVTNTGSQRDNSAVTTVYWMNAIDVDIPQTVFAAGDVLHLVVEAWSRAGAGATTIATGHDPMGRSNTVAADGALWDTTTCTSTLTFQVPVRIDL